MPPPASASPSESARLLARRLLLAQAPHDGAHAAARVTAAEYATRSIGGGLSRWFGPFGSHALVTRALARARESHPALDEVRVAPGTLASLEGLAESADAHGADAMLEGVVTMLAALSELLNRLIGADLAGGLLEQSLAGAAGDTIPPRDAEPRSTTRAPTDPARDGRTPASQHARPRDTQPDGQQTVNDNE